MTPLRELIERLYANHIEPDYEELADVLWLAVRMTRDADEPGLLFASGGKDKQAQESPDCDTPQSGENERTEKQPAAKENQAGLHANSGYGGGKTSGSGRPIRTPAAPALADALGIGRALRPLMRKTPSRSRWILDEEATVERIADNDVWLPVLKGKPERWLDLMLVVERSPSMHLWSPLIEEFHALLLRHGAFRDVRLWNLDRDAKIYTGNSESEYAARPRELLGLPGRRAIWLLSDCVSDAWQQGRYDGLLRVWSARHPLALINLLPGDFWPRTGLRRGMRTYFRAIDRSPKNACLQWERKRQEDIPWKHEAWDALKLPVVPLTADSLNDWAKLMIGRADNWSSGILLGPPLPVPASRTIVPPDLSAFYHSASPGAQRLAEYCATIPLILPVIRLLQAEMLPETGTMELAEFFLSGLLRRQNPDETRPEYFLYDFHEDLRIRLLENLRRQEILDTHTRLSRIIAEKFGHSADFLTLIPDLENAGGGLPIAPESKPFAELNLTVLRRLGGEYNLLADRQEKALLAYSTLTRNEFVDKGDTHIIEQTGTEADKNAKQNTHNRRNMNDKDNYRSPHTLLSKIKYKRQKVADLEQEFKICSEKLRRLNFEYHLEIDVATKMKLKHDVEETRIECEGIEDKLTSLEQDYCYIVVSFAEELKNSRKFNEFITDIRFQLNQKIRDVQKLIYFSDYVMLPDFEKYNHCAIYLIISSESYLASGQAQLDEILTKYSPDRQNIFVLEWESMEAIPKLSGLPVYHFWSRDSRQPDIPQDYYQCLDDLSSALSRHLGISSSPSRLVPPSDETAAPVADTEKRQVNRAVFLAQPVADVVLCYAPEDRKWADKLATHLLPWEKRAVIKSWPCDEQAIRQANIIILLLSTNLMTSSKGNEQIRLALELANKQSVQLLSIPVSSVKADLFPELAEFRRIPTPYKQTLAECSPQQCEHFYSEISRWIGRVAREITAALDGRRNNLVRALSQQGIPVLPEAVIPVQSGEETVLQASLKKSQLFVQLLDESSGAYANFQLQQARTLGLPVLQWHSPDLYRKAVKHPGLFEKDVYVQVFSDFQAYVIHEAMVYRETEVSLPEKQASLAGFVFLNAHPEDFQIAGEIKQFLNKNNIVCFTPEHGKSLSSEELREDMANNFKYCDAILIVYDKAPRAWVRQQLMFSRKYLSEREKDYKVVAVFRDGERPDLGDGYPNLMDCPWPSTCLKKFVMEYLR